ncbi:MAG: peptidoglycan-binding protein [Clostridia bacterium]|nr:peptidoglycan-binding protein [Clostridia bacterium]
MMKRWMALGLALVLTVCAGLGLAETDVSRIRTNARQMELRENPMEGGATMTWVPGNTEVEVFDQVGKWYYVCYQGQYGYLDTSSLPVTILARRGGQSGGSQAGTVPAGSWAAYDIGIPDLGGRVYRQNEMGLAIYWVQVQLKRTGVWYQGDQWDATGNLGDHTMTEIRAFMKNRGYSGHSGLVDQQVIREIAAFMNGRLEPVYAGGFYEAMDSIMTGGSTGTMTRINRGDKSTAVRWVQTILKSLGYYTSSIDGKYGDGTAKGVRAFQREYGFQERDYVTLGVARRMLEVYHDRGLSIDALP